MDIYKGNSKLKSAGVSLEFTKEQVEEIKKCYDDPVYFIKNYIKIVNIDKGLVPFELYPFQEEMVKTILGNRQVILCLPRQVGKCVCRDESIKIRNKKSLKEISISIGEFYEWQRFRNKTKQLLEKYKINNE